MRVLLVVYDNDATFSQFPIGLAYITSVLEDAGVDVDIYNQDVNHWSDEHLTAHLDKNKYDIVGYSTIAGYYQYRKLLSCSKAIRKSKNKSFFVLGGHGPAPEPEFFMRKTGADAVVIGEGEETMLELLEAVAGSRPLSSVDGIAFRDGDGFTINPRRKVIEDIDSIKWPAYHRFPMELYRLYPMPEKPRSAFVMSMLSARGCPFRCNFCYRMDPGIRLRSNESIIEEIRFLKKTYGINYISFMDELLMSSISRTVSLCEDFIKADLGIYWNCNGRLNYAKPDVLKLMKRAKCVFINYGIESFDDQILINMNKSLTTKQIVSGVEATLAADIVPGLNIIFGNIGENAETLRKGVEFLMKYDVSTRMRTIRPVTPYPGSDLYYHAIENGKIKDAEDFYENLHVNSDLPSVNFTELDDEEYLRVLYEANKTLVRHYHDRAIQATMEDVKNLYFAGATDFRGFRHT